MKDARLVLAAKNDLRRSGLDTAIMLTTKPRLSDPVAKGSVALRSECWPFGAMRLLTIRRTTEAGRGRLTVWCGQV